MRRTALPLNNNTTARRSLVRTISRRIHGSSTRSVLGRGKLYVYVTAVTV